MREVQLSSGRVFKVAPGSFSESKALYQALLEELKGIKIESQTQLASVYKDLFCSGFSSSKVEEKLWPCMMRCLYAQHKITQETFEAVEAREDFTEICLEVVKENINPFLKHLYARWSILEDLLQNSPKSELKMTS